MAARKSSAGFSDNERAAMRERARELKKHSGNGESDVLAALAQMPEADRKLGERVHALVREAAPELTPKTWYGMPAYAKDGNVVCFFQSAHKFKARYATLGFSDKAALDEGRMWPTSFALTRLGEEEEAQIRKLLKKALS